MVYDSDFYTTRRVGSSYTRPTISSYTVTTPLRYSGVPRLDTFTTTTTTYRTPMPYVAHKRIVPLTGFATSPSRVTVSPVRVYGSPVRVLRSPVRVLGSPIRVISSPIRTVVRAVRSPVRVISSPARVVTIRSSYLRPSIVNKEFDRIERKYRASPVSSAIEQYYNSPSYLEFEDEKREIRNSSALLLRQLNDPVPRLMGPSLQTATPVAEPNPKRWVYDPFSHHKNSETYVKNTITDPLRSVARDIEAMARYHSPASRYVEYVLLDDILWRYTYYVDEDGKNHLASTRIIGSQAYPKTKPRIYNYDTARVGREVNVMSHYKANRSQAKSDVEEVIAGYRRKLLLSRLIRNAKLSLMLYEKWNQSKHNKNKK
ncbi:AAEL002776-PA [Aedes aegypti]|uniref:AAEL002776-PA n=1 Tax=Aedes aegypti TaxID=7159 RepID=Q17H31_AEDAE|nr:AAEL002776-PA [Aedes aegypti]